MTLLCLTAFALLTSPKASALTENGWTGLQSVKLSESLTTIGNGVFYMCSKLRYCAIPAATKTLGSEIFRDCRAMNFVLLMGDAPQAPGNWFDSSARPQVKAYYGRNAAGFAAMIEADQAQLNWQATIR